MRLWTLHPKYLDARGLVALWREALLAQAVLNGKTRGYTRHPQLNRFRATASPVRAIATYLRTIHAESVRRGYHFDASKIGDGDAADVMTATRSQLNYEWAHLKSKLQRRDPTWLRTIELLARPQPHPLFRIIPGPIEDWEVVTSAEPRRSKLPRR
jgi:hypothetical protein